MTRKNKRNSSTSNAADSTIILGDLTDVTQISRDGSVVTLHCRETPRSFQMPNEETATMMWQALAEEAAEAVREDRQFFCVSFDKIPDAGDSSIH